MAFNLALDAVLWVLCIFGDFLPGQFRGSHHTGSAIGILRAACLFDGHEGRMRREMHGENKMHGTAMAVML